MHAALSLPGWSLPRPEPFCCAAELSGAQPGGDGGEGAHSLKMIYYFLFSRYVKKAYRPFKEHLYKSKRHSD